MVVRKYNIPDADMMEDSRTNKTIFESDKALFVALNPEFDDPFAADWLSSIEASEATETAETRDDRQRQPPSWCRSRKIPLTGKPKLPNN